MIWLYIVLTLALSALNAWSVGREWTATKAMGGIARFMTWCGAIMAAVGFTYVYFILIAMIAVASGQLSPENGEKFLQLGYLIVIVPALGSGLAITIQSWAHFWRSRNFVDGAVSVWNTYAQLANLSGAFETVPGAWDSVGSLFSSDSDEDAGVAALVFILAVLALGAGIVTTMLIVRTVDANVLRGVQFRAMAER